MSSYTASALPWWTLPVPTVDGSRILTCHYVEPSHRAARVTAGALVFCSRCRTRLHGFAWSTELRDVVLCGGCHKTDHDERDEATLRANAHDLPDELPGQTAIEL